MDIVGRLKTFIASTGLQTSQFADRAGIPRPTLSQLLSGRNKKVSNELIDKIHSSFPALNVLWLLFGEGDMACGAFTSSSASQNAVFDSQITDSQPVRPQSDTVSQDSQKTVLNTPQSPTSKYSGSAPVGQQNQRLKDLFTENQGTGTYRHQTADCHNAGASQRSFIGHNSPSQAPCAAEYEEPVPYGNGLRSSQRTAMNDFPDEEFNHSDLSSPAPAKTHNTPGPASRQIAYIMVCYTDSSFEIFNPSDSHKKQQ